MEEEVNPYKKFSKILNRNWFDYISVFSLTVNEFQKWIFPPKNHQGKYNILDIGPGVGVFLDNASKRLSRRSNVTLYGTDIYPYKSMPRRDNLKIYNGDIVYSHLPNNSMNRILCSYSVGYYAQTQSELNEHICALERLLCVDGEGMLISRSYTYDPENIRTIYFEETPFGTRERESFLNLKEAFQQTNLKFEIVKALSRSEIIVKFSKPVEDITGISLENAEV